MIWLDNSSEVVKWNSEEVVIPYISKKDNRQHRYFVDFYIEFTSGKKFLVEVKPFNQTQKPVPKGTTMKQKKRFLNEVQTYAVNTSKWTYASEFAKKNGMIFAVWTEKELTKLGIPTQASKRFRAITRKNNGKKKNKKT